MDSLINLTRNILQRISAVNARLVGIIRNAYEQILALLTWPIIRNQQVTCMEIVPWAVSPLCVEDEPEDEPENEYTQMRREAVLADQRVLAAILAWKQSEKNLLDALLAGKRLTFSKNDEVRDLEIANNAAEEVMLDAIVDRTKLHMEHCDECERIIAARCTTLQVYKASQQNVALKVKNSPRKLLAITYGDDIADEEKPHELNRRELLALPAPEVFQKVVELPPCQVEKKSAKPKSCPLKKKSSQPKPRPRWR